MSQSFASKRATAPVVVQTFTVPLSACFLEGQVEFWQKHGYQLHLLTSDIDQLPPWVAQTSATTHNIPFRRAGFSLFSDLICLVHLYQYFKKVRPTLVHGNTPKAAFLTIVAASLSNIPHRIYEMHGLPLETTTGAKRIVLWLIEKIGCRLATQVIAVSSSLRQTVVALGLVASSKIQVMHHGTCNGVDAERKFNPALVDLSKIVQMRVQWQLATTHPTVGFVGRLATEKGLGELYEAWQMVKNTHPNARLLVVGNTDERDPIPLTLVSDFQKDSSIILAGHATDIAHCYALIDFLVLPSHREGFGNVVLEAAAMAKPAVVSQVTGLKNAVVAQQTGLFCEVRCAASLAQQMLFYLNNPALAEIHGKTARQRVLRNFRPNDVWRAKWYLYQRLLASHKVVNLRYVSPVFQTTH